MIKVKVLKRHVERAKKLRGKAGIIHCDECPIALAIKEKTHKKVYVEQSFIEYNKYHYDTNENERKFIKNFDNGDYSELKTPFIVTLERSKRSA